MKTFHVKVTVKGTYKVIAKDAERAEELMQGVRLQEHLSNLADDEKIELIDNNAEYVEEYYSVH